MANRIVICKGNSQEPSRFWDWAVCKKEEFNDAMKRDGWAKSDVKKYLTPNQLSYLNGAN